MGADRIFNQWVGLDPDSVVPLSIAHGVDFSHWTEPVDIEKVEPIHWAYNREILSRSTTHKPSILAPHPLMMLGEQPAPAENLGTLVIAAPPGPENDKNLYCSLKHLKGPISILVKPRGNFNASIEYWKRQGFNALTAGQEGPEFYQNLHRILSGANRVVGCNFSSALVFASALGKEVELLSNYWHHTYLKKFGHVDYVNPAVREIVVTFLHRGINEAKRVSRRLLGVDAQPDRMLVRNSYLEAIDRLRLPLHFSKSHGWLHRLLYGEIARLTGRTGAVNYFWRGLREEVFGRDLYATRINEIALWETGDAATYFQQAPRARYQRARTEWGLAVEAYEDSRRSPQKSPEPNGDHVT